MKQVFEFFDNYGLRYSILSKNIENVPLVYKRKYKFTFLEFYNEPVLLLSATRNFSLDSFVSDSLFLAQRLLTKVVIVLDNPDLDEMNRLIKSNIAFISSSGIFMPFLGLIFSQVLKPQALRSEYTVTQQRVLIEILLNPSKEILVEELANNLDLSVPTIYRSLRTFSDYGYIKSMHGKYIYLKSRNEIHTNSLTYYTNLIGSNYTINKEIIKFLNTIEVEVFASGFDAVSKYSQITLQNKIFEIVEDDLLKFLEGQQEAIKKMFDKSTKNKAFFEKHEDSIDMIDHMLNRMLKNDSIVNKIDKSILKTAKLAEKLSRNFLRNEEGSISKTESYLFNEIIDRYSYNYDDSMYLFYNSFTLHIWKYRPKLMDGSIDPISLSLLNFDIIDKPREEEAIKSLRNYIYNLLRGLDVK